MSRRQSMDRRSFLINSGLVGTMGGLLSAPAFAQGTAAAPDIAAGVSSVVDIPTRHFVMTQTYDLRAPEGSTGPTRLWVPLPESMLPHQVLRSEERRVGAEM